MVETKRFISSFVHVILTRQTCGQLPRRAAESKCRALGNYFSERIYCMFLISKCRGDRDLGLRTTLGLACGEPQCNANFWGGNVFRRRRPGKNRILYVSIVYWIEVNLILVKNLKTSLINHTRLRTKKDCSARWSLDMPSYTHT